MPDRPHDGPAGTGRQSAGDIGRRVTSRREQLGLSREELALRTGSAPGYIEYLETQPGTPGIGFLLRLANALEMTIDELMGGTANLPPGTGRAAYHPQLVELSRQESWELLGSHGVGRVAITNEAGPAILPVNYLVLGEEVAFKTSPESGPARAPGHEVAFEVDRIDEAFSRGWSVLVVGEAHAVTDPQAVERLEAHNHSEPWAGGTRGLWIVVTADRVTGRRIVVPDLE